MSSSNVASKDNVMTYNANKIGLIGSGNLAQILMKGFISTDVVQPNCIISSDVNKATLKVVSETLGVETTTSNIEVAQKSDVIIVAVEPHIVPHVLQEIQPYLTADHLIISVAAGVTIDTITKFSKTKEAPTPRVVRVMANTPTAIQCGVSILSLGEHATERDSQLTKLLFSSVGLCEIIKESYLDAVTGLSGSGPAYVYIAIEALSDGGVKMGLPREFATKLAAQTLMGASKMVLETGQHPGQLKDGVTSPGGTTIAGLHALEKAGFRCSLMNAVEAATLRSKELGSQK